MKLANFFEARQRDNGEDFVTLTDDSPEWMHDAVRYAHCGDFPGDWIYQECRDACEAIDAGDLNDESLGEYADGRVEIYTRDRFQWATDHCLGSLYAEAESRVEDMGGYGERDTGDRIALVQYCAIEIVAGTMLRAAEDE